MCGRASVFHEYVLLREMENVKVQMGVGDVSVGNDYAVN